MVRLRRAAAALSLLLGAACGGADGPPRLVVLYAPCTVNKRFLAPYEPDVAYTPHLARFAERAVTFRDHWTEAGSSGIAYASILSGTHADQHGIHRHPQRLADDVLLIFEAFREQGWETYHWNTHGMVPAQLGYAQGVPAEHRFARQLAGDDPDFRAVLERLRADPEARALVWASFTVTHGPYATDALDAFRRDFPEAVRGATGPRADRLVALYTANDVGLSWSFDATARRLGLGPPRQRRLAVALEALYASRVHVLDRLFGGVLDALEEAELAGQSLVAFTADHGEVLFRERAPFQWSHSMQLAPEVLSPPLLLAYPGSERAPRDYRGTTRSIDLLPTLAGLAEVPLPPGAPIAGRDLTPVLYGREPLPALDAFSHTTVLVRSVAEQMRDPLLAPIWEKVARLFPSEDPRLVWVSLKRGALLFEHRRLEDGGWVHAAYDPVADPEQAHDRFDAGDEAHRAAAAALAAYKERLVESYFAGHPGEAARMLSPDEEAESLRALGYIE